MLKTHFTKSILSCIKKTNEALVYILQQMQKTDVCLETSSSCTWMQKWRNERRLDADICLFIDKDI